MKLPLRHKFRARPIEHDGIKFPSKKEARHYDKLKLAVQSGKLLFFLRQVPIHLPGGVIYRVDFLEFWADGSVSFRDIKGFKTESYKAKKRMVEQMYPIIIEES